MKNGIAVLVLVTVLSMSCFSWAEEGPSGGATAAAVVSDIIWVPGKAAVCATSGVLWTVGMVLTAGMIYRQAGDLVHGACTGKWVLTGEDFSGDTKDL